MVCLTEFQPQENQQHKQQAGGRPFEPRRTGRIGPLLECGLFVVARCGKDAAAGDAVGEHGSVVCRNGLGVDDATHGWPGRCGNLRRRKEQIERVRRQDWLVLRGRRPLRRWIELDDSLTQRR